MLPRFWAGAAEIGTLREAQFEGVTPSEECSLGCVHLEEAVDSPGRVSRPWLICLSTSGSCCGTMAASSSRQSSDFGMVGTRYCQGPLVIMAKMVCLGHPFWC